MYMCTCKFLPHLDKDVLHTDRDHPLFSDPDSPKLVQLEDILKTYVMYNFDLGNSRGCWSVGVLTNTTCYNYPIMARKFLRGSIFTDRHSLLLHRFDVHVHAVIHCRVVLISQV